jgi:hypothetical protein
MTYMKHTLIVALIFFLLPAIVLFSCTKANEQQLQGGGGTVCDTVGMTYSGDVVPILQANCYSCHGNGNTGGSGGINLDGYENIQVYAQNGTLAKVITHAPGYPAMPYGLPKLDECSINKILDWINRGAPND